MSTSKNDDKPLRRLLTAARLLALCAAKCALVAMAMTAALAARAADTPAVTGLWLTTDFPALAARAGGTATVKIKLQNTNLPPQRVALTVNGVPSGWKANIVGGGVPVAAAMPSTNESVALQLRIDIPAGAKHATQRLVLVARGDKVAAELPIDITTGQDLPARLSVKAKLPSLRGSARTSFEYPFTVQNESDKDLLVKLVAQAPQGFRPTFTESYGSQEINSIPIEAGQNKELKVKVQPPELAPASDYPLEVSASAEGAQATTRMVMQITGQPKLRLTTEDGRLSGEAEAGQAAPLSAIVANDGAAPATGIEFSSTPPADWKIEMQPPTIPLLAPGEKRAVQAIITPSSKAIAGDYMATLRASSGGESTSADFRITVTTSTIWGMAGVLVIAIALLLSVGAVARFGRR